MNYHNEARKLFPSYAEHFPETNLETFQLNMDLRASAWKNNSDQITAIRETGISRRHGDPLKAPPKLPGASQHNNIKGGPKLGPHFVEIRPPDRGYIFFSSRLVLAYILPN